MFFKRMNTFENWESGSDENEQALLSKGSDEIEKLINSYQPLAIDKIKLSQEKQKNVQNNRTRILQDSLSKGTTVFIKSEVLIGKLDARYSGPYKVLSKTARGTYD